jgi:two-component system, cell cycle response regulator
VADEWDEDTTGPATIEDVVGVVDRGRNRPCLTVLSGNATGHVFKIAPGANTIGRHPNAELRIMDDGVSRQHAVVHREGNDLWVEDLDSRNGTYVNGNKIAQRTRLTEGDKLQVGRTTVLRFAYQDELDESFHESLLSSALRDPNTKLFNKRYLMDRLDSELKFARRHQATVSLLMLDLDHFKAINDTHGHLAGDAVLARLASVLVHAVRNEDVVARFGGEEFAIILRAISLELALQLGERLRKLVELTVTVHQDKELRATVSIGIASYPATPAETVPQLVDAADQALYRAKHAGRNRVSR